MTEVYCDEGLNHMLLTGLSQNVRYHLFTHDYTPIRTSVIGNFTGSEAAWTGYAVVTLIPADWVTLSVVGHIGFCSTLPKLFTNSSGSTVQAYGYYVTDNTDSKVIKAARFDEEPRDFPDGENYIFTPTFGDKSRAISA